MSIKIVPQFTNGLCNAWVNMADFGARVKFIIPFVDKVAYKVTTKDIVLDIPSQEVITRDNVVIIANAVAYINIVHLNARYMVLENYEIGIRNWCDLTFYHW